MRRTPSRGSNRLTVTFLESRASHGRAERGVAERVLTGAGDAAAVHPGATRSARTIPLDQLRWLRFVPTENTDIRQLN
jgi:hypothetical protein